MAKSKSKRKRELQDKRDAQKFVKVVVAATVILMILFYILFQSA